MNPDCPHIPTFTVGLLDLNKQTDYYVGIHHSTDSMLSPQLISI